MGACSSEPWAGAHCWYVHVHAAPLTHPTGSWACTAFPAQHAGLRALRLVHWPAGVAWQGACMGAVGVAIHGYAAGALHAAPFFLAGGSALHICGDVPVPATACAQQKEDWLLAASVGCASDAMGMVLCSRWHVLGPVMALGRIGHVGGCV